MCEIIMVSEHKHRDRTDLISRQVPAIKDNMCTNIIKCCFTNWSKITYLVEQGRMCNWYGKALEAHTKSHVIGSVIRPTRTQASFNQKMHRQSIQHHTEILRKMGLKLFKLHFAMENQKANIHSKI